MTMTMTMAQPCSPPDLSYDGSKSSKSSSFHSSYQSDDNVDLSNFEDIGLEDDADTAGIDDDDFTVKVSSTTSLPSFNPYSQGFTAGGDLRPKRPSFRSSDPRDATMKVRQAAAVGRQPVRSITSDATSNAYGQPLRTNTMPPSSSSSSSRNNFMNPSSPSFSTSTLGNAVPLHLRSRTPSPHSLGAFYQQNNRSANASSTSLNRPPSRRSSWYSNKERERKTAKELEKECDDEDDDEAWVPEGCFLENVPISPRPQSERERASSDRFSPERRQVSPGKKEKRTPSMGNGTPAVPVAQGSLRSPISTENGSGFKEQRRLSTTQHGATRSTTQPPMAGKKKEDDSYFLRSTRAKSWTAALGDLSPEVQALTARLEEHADDAADPPGVTPAPGAAGQGQRRSMNPAVPAQRPSFEGGGGGVGKARQTQSAIAELPPLRKNNIMIDPLPISKEKEKVLSRTRPSWLPPKDRAEERRHLREYARMMRESGERERRRADDRRRSALEREGREAALAQIWEERVLADWDAVMVMGNVGAGAGAASTTTATTRRRVSKSVRELWWGGVASRVRGRVWQRAVGNELALSETSYEAALRRARELERRTTVTTTMGGSKGGDCGDDASHSQSSSSSSSTTWQGQARRSRPAQGLTEEESRFSIGLAKINRDLQHTWPELGLFRNDGNVEGPLHGALRDVLCAYSVYRGDVGYVEGTNTIAALLLLNLPSAPSAFITLANLLNRPLPLSFHTRDAGATARVHELALGTLSTKHPQLAHHLANICHRTSSATTTTTTTTTTTIPTGSSPSSSSGYPPSPPGGFGNHSSAAAAVGVVLEEPFRDLFTGQLRLEHACRLWDVWALEGDAVLVRAAVALLGACEAELLGARTAGEARAAVATAGTRAAARELGKDASASGAARSLADESPDEWMARVREAGRERSG